MGNLLEREFLSEEEVAVREAALGVFAHLGWATTSIIAVEKRELLVLRTDRIETAKPGDREALEPYHIAGGFKGLERVPTPPKPEASVQRGLRKQRRHTAAAIAGLQELMATEGRELAFAGLLVSRGRSADVFEKAIGSHTQIHIEEGNAVRESVRLALRDAGVRVHDVDQKAVATIASKELARQQIALLAELGAKQPANGGPWRKEEKLAALAAWIAWFRGATR